MTELILAIGLVLSLEGLVLALLPARLEEVLALLARIPLDTRRRIGLIATACGVAMVWIAQRGLM